MGGDIVGEMVGVYHKMLKSTPPAWAGTYVLDLTNTAVELKSTPPAWAGTAVDHSTITGQ